MVSEQASIANYSPLLASQMSPFSAGNSYKATKQIPLSSLSLFLPFTCAWLPQIDTLSIKIYLFIHYL